MGAHTKSEHFALWEKFVATDPFVEPPTVGKFMELDAQETVKCAAEPGSRFCVNVRFTAKPDRREEMREMLQKNLTETLATEPLALAHAFGQSESDENTFHVHEEWEGRQGFELHISTPHVKKWFEFVATGPMAEEQKVAFYFAPRDAE